MLIDDVMVKLCILIDISFMVMCLELESFDSLLHFQMKWHPQF